MAWALAKENKVLFVEPPFTLLAPLRDRNISWRQLLNIGRLKHQGRNLYSFPPLKLFPPFLSCSSCFNFDAANKKNVFNQLKNCVQKLNFKNPVLWVFFSDRQYDYYGLFNESVTVGDLYDKFTTPTWEGMLPKHIEPLRQMQNTIIEKSDIIFTVSKLLFEEFSQIHKNVFLVPNGVDFESFESSNGPIKIGKLKKPVLGFLGMLHYKVDFNLLYYIAQTHPEWTLLLMGKDNIHSNSDRLIFERLKKKDNVVWTREIERESIPSFLNSVDVCIVPLKKIAMNRYANYLKIWEYLAAGKPIVSVDQGISYEYPDLIRLADSKEEFVDNIAKALKEDTDEELVKQRKNVAMTNSWDSRVREMLDIIDGFLLKKRQN